MSDVDVVVFFGQSNMEGYSLAKYLPEDKYQKYLKGFSNVKICYECNWTNISQDFVNVKLGQGFNDGRLRFGPEIGFAEEIANRSREKEIYIIKYTLGGTRFKEHWNIENGFCYYYFKKHLKYSLNLLKSKGFNPHILMFAYMQGESDAIEKEDVENYKDREYEMIKNVFEITSEYIDKDTFFLDCGLLDIVDCFPRYEEINKAKLANSKRDTRIKFLSTIDLKMTATKEREEEIDYPHYDSESMLIFGKAIASFIK